MSSTEKYMFEGWGGGGRVNMGDLFFNMYYSDRMVSFQNHKGKGHK